MCSIIWVRKQQGRVYYTKSALSAKCVRFATVLFKLPSRSRGKCHGRKATFWRGLHESSLERKMCKEGVHYTKLALSAKCVGVCLTPRSEIVQCQGPPFTHDQSKQISYSHSSLFSKLNMSFHSFFSFLWFAHDSQRDIPFYHIGKVLECQYFTCVPKFQIPFPLSLVFPKVSRTQRLRGYV